MARLIINLYHNTMKQKAYRHGEIMLLKINKLPKGLKQTETNIFMTGSHGNNHSFDNAKLYFVNEDNGVFGYINAKDTKLFHPEHGNKNGEPIENGYYKLIKQVEYTPDGLVPIVD